MATIIKRNKHYSVVYKYFDENGKQRQKWETFNTSQEAKKRLKEVEYSMQNDTFIIPSATTIKDLLNEFCNTYGKTKWAFSTYEGNLSLIKNYIDPLIGDIKLDDVNSRIMGHYFQSLQKVKQPKNKYRKNLKGNVTPATIKSIYKLLNSAFSQAVKWEMIAKNPVMNVTLPKVEYNKRQIWDAKTMAKALELCDDEILSLAINLSFACCLRIGEMLGLTWDCVNISDKAIKENEGYIYINKELQRISNKSYEELGNKDIILFFPSQYSTQSTSLVLKKPKTQTSNRKVFLPNTVAEMLKNRKQQINKMKELFGNEYQDFDLIFAHNNGSPIEGQVINRALKKLIKKHNLPDIVFHSFRHASVTYKLKWNNGDMKSVQGDSGHASIDMIADVYSHIIDEDRKHNAEKFDELFYHSKAKEIKDKDIPVPEFEIKVKDTKEKDDKLDIKKINKLLEDPKMVELLKALTKNL